MSFIILSGYGFSSHVLQSNNWFFKLVFIIHNKDIKEYTCSINNFTLLLHKPSKNTRVAFCYQNCKEIHDNPLMHFMCKKHHMSPSCCCCVPVYVNIHQILLLNRTVKKIQRRWREISSNPYHPIGKRLIEKVYPFNELERT